jgi:predicted double-glycine peptidase
MSGMARNSHLTSWKIGLLTVVIFPILFLGCGKYVRLDNLAGTPSLHVIQNFIRVPLTRQGTDYTCGIAALQAILYYYGEEFREDELVKKLQPTINEGTKYREIAKFAQSLNFRVDVRTKMTLDDLQRLINEKKPVILLIQAWPESRVDYTQDWDDGHYVVAVGYDHQNIYFMDPSTLGNYTFIPVREFLDRWHDRDGQTYLHQFGMVLTKEPAREIYNPDKIKRMR